MFYSTGIGRLMPLVPLFRDSGLLAYTYIHGTWTAILNASILFHQTKIISMKHTNSYPRIFNNLLLLAISTTTIISCGKKDDKNPDPGGNGGNKTENYIPAQNHKYNYNIIMEDKTTHSFVTWISDVKDSSGLKVYNMRTRLNIDDIEVITNTGMVSVNGQTVTQFDMPALWRKAIEDMKSQEGVTILEATPKGFPAYEIFDNAMVAGSKLTYKGPAEQGQYIKYVTAAEDGDTIELFQKIIYQPGQVTSVENITVPGGTFKCSRWTAKSDARVIMKMNGQQISSTLTHEEREFWNAYGVGIVKAISVSAGDSTVTTLQSIE